MSDPKRNSEKRLRVLITIIGVLLIAAHLIWPGAKIDAITLGLVVLACLPWLSSIIKSIEIPGVGKLELQEIKDQLKENRGAIESVAQKAEFAVADTTAGPEAARIADPALATGGKEILTGQINEYNRLRKDLTSGAQRTTEMTKVVKQMVALAPYLPDFNVPEALKSGDRGVRLSAYAYLYAQPDFTQLRNLIESISKIEDKPFGQYWGIQALQKVIAKRPPGKPLDMNAIRDLKLFYAGLQAGTDRHYELGKVLKDIDS